MDAQQAQLYLQGLKKQVRQRELFEALDVAIEALAWKVLDDKLEAEIDIESGTVVE